MGKDKIDKSQKIGITETGDPSFHLELFDNLYDGNIIVTKRLTDKIKLIGSKGQRNHCSCPMNKTQLIKDKPQRCANKCLYCFWKS